MKREPHLVELITTYGILFQILLVQTHGNANEEILFRGAFSNLLEQLSQKTAGQWKRLMLSRDLENHLEWSYDRRNGIGPEKWAKTYEKCRGLNQSPININSRLAKPSERAKPILLKDYSLFTRVKPDLSAAGLRYIFPPGFKITGGSLPASYMLKSMSLHWATTNEKGSEHSMNGDFFPLEIQFFHEKLTDISEVEIELPKIAIISVLYELSFGMNQNLEGLLNSLQHSFLLNVSSIFPPKSVTKFGGESSNFDAISSYFRYVGSLTTPPCDENVIWSILKEKGTVSAAQLVNLRKIYEKFPELENNFRPLQYPNGRILYDSGPGPLHFYVKADNYEMQSLNKVKEKNKEVQNGQRSADLVKSACKGIFANFVLTVVFVELVIIL